MGTCRSQWKMFLPMLLILFSTVGSSTRHHHSSSSATRCRLAEEAVSRREIQMREGAPFKVVMFADLHFGENAWTDWGPLQDVNSIKVMNTVIYHETPDFVVYLGDVITGNNIMVGNASLYWDQATSAARERGIPWASVFGNHDDAQFEWPLEWFSLPGIPQIQCPPTTTSYSGEECNFKGIGRLELMKNEMEKNASFSSHGPRNLWPSVSNYVLQVSSPGDLHSPVAFLYFLDSGGGSYPEVVSSQQAEWFLQKAEEINSDSRVPEIIFWHIPSTAYKVVAPKSSIQKPCVGSINKESVASQEAEMGIMDLLANRTSVKAVFVGHNHGLDWCCPYKKLWLCYARHTGYGGYGDWPRGSRVLEINQKPFSLRSWIRMEDGIVHSEIVFS
ncbi:putative metallo-dependent phosphatase [Lupinus albus]|uniref:Putative metallo-dependent phosphatase n=1 Tax=Lupinus albus TaxID=3870 RepID=A0A6A4R1Y3_LUPAL|nr:putative metallo-dependent phosphatase [Lupinus albus]